MSEWLEIVIPAEPGTAEDVAAIVSDAIEAASNGAELRSSEVVFWVAVQHGEQVLSETRAVVRELAARGMPVDASTVCARPAVPEQEWRDAWKKYFRSTRLTRQFVVVPSWDTFDDPGPEDILIHLDPGQAFGTGAHASTQLVLSTMQTLRDAGAHATRFLDIGTGSGILAVAATKLWPDCSGRGIDTDAYAIAAAIENAERNGASDRMQFDTTPIDQIDSRFDLVVANIQAVVLTELRDPIVATLEHGAPLILSGLLTTAVDQVAKHYARAGMTIERILRSESDSEWSSVLLGRDSQ